MTTKRLKPSSGSAPSSTEADAPTDTRRLDKLERIEKQIRGARWFFTRDGIVVAAKKKKPGPYYFTSLRQAIDATEDPREADEC